MPDLTRDEINEALAEFMGWRRVQGSTTWWLVPGTNRYSPHSPDIASDLNLLLGKGGVWAKMTEKQRKVVACQVTNWTYNEPCLDLDEGLADFLNWLVEAGPEALARACAEAVKEGESDGVSS